jgi:hypothetical protein
MSQQNPNEPPFGVMDYGFSRPSDVGLAGNYEDSKPGLGKVYHENEIATAFRDEEPLLTPSKLVSIHLFGVPLVSNIKNPLTNRPAQMTEELLKQFILEAVSLGEAESKIDIFPRQYAEKLEFDRCEYDQFGFMQLRHRPIASLESLTVTPSNQDAVYQIPNEWVDVGALHLGQLNLIPLTLALKSGTMIPLSSSPAGSVFLSIFGNRPYIPSFFQVRYTAGCHEGAVPKIINQYLGCIAAMEVLSSLATTYARSNSTSLGIDGLSQSVSTSGAEIYKQRMEELSQKRHWILGRLQAAFNMSFIVGNV